MNYIIKGRDQLLKLCPTYESLSDSNRSYTSKVLYNRSRIGISRLFGAGFHMEGEHSLFDRRYKLPMFRHFRYLGPRGEIFVYFLLLVGITKLIKNNLKREENIESLLNDKNTYFKVELPLIYRKLE